MGVAAAALAGWGTVDEVGIDVLDASQGITAVVVRNLSTSANSLLINVPGMHGSDYMLLEAGQVEVYRVGSDGIKTVNAKALDNSAVATITWGVTALI